MDAALTMTYLSEQDLAEGRGEAAFRKRRWHHRRDIRFLAFVFAVLALFYGYGYATGPSKLTGRLTDRLASDSERANIVVTTRFPPEAFHMSIYQELGRVGGTNGNDALLYRVRSADVRALSRQYWVVRIDLAPEPPGR